MNRLLVVDDDPRLRESLLVGLGAQGYDCVPAADAGEARHRLAEPEPFDLVLLDVTLPDEAGWSVLEELRASGDVTPVIFLTAHHETADRVRGLRLGADDYVGKPFELDELLARVEAVLRRHRPPVVFEVGDVVVDLGERAVRRGTDVVELSKREFELLAALIEANGETLSRAELLERVWEIRFDPGTNVVDVLVGRVRRKLDVDGAHTIQTVVGEGYRVVARRVSS